VSEQAAQTPDPLLVIVTGLSGAGNSTALRALADAGMYCIDNLPMELLGPTIALLESGRIVADHGLALCMDVRDQSFAGQFPAIKRQLAARLRLEVVFLTADAHVLATRFGATRRKHPLLRGGETLMEVIAHEREMLGPVEEAADTVFDTSTWSPHQLARAMETRLGDELPARMLHVTVTSFGFKYGQVQPVDTLFDVRFLDNPYFVPELKSKSGLEPEVRDFIFSHAPARALLAKVEDMLRFLLPLYYMEGKHYFRLGIGCTGGRHRSVCLAEELGQAFLRQPIPNTILTIIHRDIDHH
jgi:UPF0042 nucleotide-binding protein